MWLREKAAPRWNSVRESGYYCCSHREYLARGGNVYLSPGHTLKNIKFKLQTFAHKQNFTWCKVTANVYLLCCIFHANWIDLLYFFYKSVWFRGSCSGCNHKQEHGAEMQPLRFQDVDAAAAFYCCYCKERREGRNSLSLDKYRWYFFVCPSKRCDLMTKEFPFLCKKTPKRSEMC